MFKPIYERIHAAIISNRIREAASELHVMSAAIVFLDNSSSRSCVASSLRSNWNSIIRLDRNNDEIVKSSCKLFQKLLYVLKKQEAKSSGFLSEIIKRLSSFSAKPCVLECVGTIVEIHGDSNEIIVKNLLSITSKSCLSKCHEDPALCASYFEMLHRYYVFKSNMLYECEILPQIVNMSARFVDTDDRIISRSVLRFLTSVLRLTKRTRKDITQKCVANSCNILIQSLVNGITSTSPPANFKHLGNLLFVLVKDYGTIVLPCLSNAVLRSTRIVYVSHSSSYFTHTHTHTHTHRYDKTSVPVKNEERQWFIKAAMKLGRSEKTTREFLSLVSDFCGVCRRTKEGSVLREWTTNLNE
jgi:hypothetical protein